MFEAIGEGHKIMHEGPKKELDLDELERLAKAATPGPWKVVISDKYGFTVAILPPDFPQTPLVGRAKDEQDAAYITAACNAVPELIAENRALREDVACLKSLEWRDGVIADLRNELKATRERC